MGLSGSVRNGIEPLSFFYIGPRPDLFGRVEKAAALPRRSGTTDGCTPGEIDQTGTAQKRCEIIDLAMVVEDFIVQRGEELRETHLLFRRDLLERVPERHFQPDRGAAQ